MKRYKQENQRIARRGDRVRAKISGTAERPRLSVFRSISHIYAQLIDDTTGKTILTVKDKDVAAKVKGKIEQATAVGKALAEKALEKKISQAVFDKGSFKYHGRVKAVAEGAREAGLKI